MINIKQHVQSSMHNTLKLFNLQVGKVYPPGEINVAYLCFIKIEIGVRDFIRFKINEKC